MSHPDSQGQLDRLRAAEKLYRQIAAGEVVLQKTGDHRHIDLDLAVVGDTAEALARAQLDSWRCFHCDEVFYDREAAAEHFGLNEMESPICVEAATKPLQELAAAIRDVTRRLLKTEDQLEQAEFERDCWAQAGRKELGDPYATWHGFSERREGIRGEMLATQAILAHLIRSYLALPISDEIDRAAEFRHIWKQYDSQLVDPADYLEGMKK